VVLTCVLVMLGFLLNEVTRGSDNWLQNMNRKPSECRTSFGHYRGHIYNTEEGGTIGTPTCLVESKWMKVQQHSVKLKGSNDNVIHDWLWIDYHDRVNVLVQDGSSSDRRFLIFRQTKYALEGRTSLAIVGGIIEPGESPEHTAEREVEEELGRSCKNFEFLGRFRTDVNRGMGWVNSFIALDCKKIKRGDKKINELETHEEVGAADTERQELSSMTVDQLRSAVKKGEFLEVQWSNTVALALLHMI